MNMNNNFSKQIKIKYIRKPKIKKTSKFKSCIYEEPLNHFLKQNPILLKKFNYKYVKYINTFLNTLDKNPNIDLNLLYKNLQTLSIKEKNNFNRLIFFSTTTMGAYKLKRNQIELLINNSNSYIFHELLHCASFKKEQKSYTTGFFKQFPKFSIGRALNEGYTSLLEKRYFSENCNENNYANLRFIVQKIEILVGKEIMEKLYFTADLNGLINEFMKYGKTKEEIVFFLDELDFIKYNLGIPENKSFCQDALYDITNFITNCYKKKCYIYKDTTPYLNSFINDFQTKIKSNEITYKFLKDDFMIYQSNKIKEYYISEVNNFKKYYKN